MLTELKPEIRATHAGRAAERILRTCVHCGFCLATCPTYRLLGDELDSPRGRIYLIKSLLEDKPASAATRLHLDRCLTCRACETTCPSGVEYAQLLEIGREAVQRQLPRPAGERLQRWLLRQVLPYRRRFAGLLWLGRWLRPWLPARLRQQIPPHQPASARPAVRHARQVILVEGCVQPALRPNINAAAARVLDRLGISCLRVAGEGCCGALDLHLGASQPALAAARRNIDRWWPLLEQGVEAILVTASGCGVTVKEYGRLLQADPDYAGRARQISELARDPAELLAAENITALPRGQGRIVFQSPCTLQHGQQLAGVTEKLLQRLGFCLQQVAEADQCCGSAGTYSLLQPVLSRQLRDRKAESLRQADAEAIVTANIGCLLQLQQGGIDAQHWLELVDARLAAGGSG